MDRTEYLKLCQKVSVLKDESCGTKKNIPPDLIVKYKGISYYPIGYEMSFNKGNVCNLAILHCLDANAVTKGILEGVKND